MCGAVRIRRAVRARRGARVGRRHGLRRRCARNRRRTGRRGWFRRDRGDRSGGRVTVTGRLHRLGDRDGRNLDGRRRRRWCSSRDRGSVHRLSGCGSLGLSRSGGVMDRLLRRDVGRLTAANGRGTSFRLGDGVRRNGGGGSSRFGRRCRSTLASTRSRGSRGRGLGKAGALFTLPPGPDPRHLIIGQPALRAQHRHVHRAQHGDHFIHVDLEFACHIHDAQLAQTQPPKVTPSARCRARWLERPAPTLRR